MIVSMPTGSQMDRIVRCPASAAMPPIHDANPQEDRDRGTEMHKFLERVIKVGRDAALAECDEKHRPFCESINVAKIADRLKLSSEVALAYNFREDTARRLEVLEHRAYEVDPSCEIPLTVDVAGVGADAVVVADFKGPHGWLPAPNQSMQLGLGALALARVYESPRADVEYIRIRDDGEPLRFDASLDIFALEAAADRVATTMRAVDEMRAEVERGAAPPVTEGPWCRYCPAKRTCPAKTAEIRAVVAMTHEAPYTITITPENAAEVYRTLHKAREAIAMIEGGLYAYAKTTPIPLGTDEDGAERWFGEVSRPGNDVLAGAVVHQVLTEEYGGEAANKAVTMEATKAAITNVAREHLQAGEKITHTVEGLLKKVRERGGISNPQTTSTREYTVAPDGVAKVRKRKAR